MVVTYTADWHPDSTTGNTVAVTRCRTGDFSCVASAVKDIPMLSGSHLDVSMRSSVGLSWNDVVNSDVHVVVTDAEVGRLHHPDSPRLSVVTNASIIVSSHV